MGQHRGEGRSRNAGYRGRHHEDTAAGTQAQRDARQAEHRARNADKPQPESFAAGNRLDRPHHPRGWDSSR
jgi:hypothetical protein